ncbi:MAG TPA: substrate-binding domain-containing protein, partial [Armatimonadota bacterium]
PPTALITCYSSFGGRIVQQAYALDIKIPRDLSILSCSYHPQITPFLTPPLTGINEQPEVVGQQACALLLHRMANPAEAYDSFITVKVPPQLIEGNSCAPPTIRGPSR